MAEHLEKINSAKLATGLAMHRQGQFEAAEVLYQEILTSEPTHFDALQLMATMAAQRKNGAKALALFDQMLAIKPDHFGVLYNRGLVLQELHEHEAALASYERALQIKPDDVDTLNNRGNALLALKRPVEALESYDRVLKQNPTHASTLYNRGNVLQSLKRHAEALESYGQALLVNPNHLLTLYNRAVTLQALNCQEQALAGYERVLHLDPDNVDALYAHGNVLQVLKRYEEALASYQRALQLRPDDGKIRNNRAVALQSLKHFAPALEDYEHALRIDPNDIVALKNRGRILCQMGREVEAAASYRKVLALDPDNISVRLALLMTTLPIAPQSIEASMDVPAQFGLELNQFSDWLQMSGRYQGLFDEVVDSFQSFCLAYRQGNHKALLSQYGDLVTRSFAHLRLPPRPRRNKLRLLVISEYMHRHSVWDILTRGIFEQIDTDLFEVIAYHLGSGNDEETAWAKSKVALWRDSTTMMGFDQWVRAAATDLPDAIYYPEVGISALVEKLAACRLAPLQMTSWGHPITTGLPSIDVFFSGELLEPQDADSHYRERLIRLPGTGACTTPIAMPAEPWPELDASLALMKKGVRFVMPHTGYKLDPMHDGLYADIAAVVGDCVFILFKDPIHPWATDRAMARLQQVFKGRGLDPERHFLLIPWLSRPRFYGLLELCDICLDCPSFSGYTTAWQALHCGLPIVTLEGKFMRQRLAAGLLRKAGVTDTIANSQEKYVAIATQLAKECATPLVFAKRRRTLKTAAARVDHDLDVIRAFERFVLEHKAD